MEAGSFVFDVNRCTGCGACRLACTIENRLAPAVSWRRIETFNPHRQPTAPVLHLSIACNHCATAACMHACPALAYRREPMTGAVLLDSLRCIGCGYCSWACPYDAPVFDEAAGVMTKCTWCGDRLKAGLKPACATHCPTGALDYAVVPPSQRALVLSPSVAVLQEESESRGTRCLSVPDIGLDPSLHVVALKPGRTQPEMADVGAQPFTAAFEAVLKPSDTHATEGVADVVPASRPGGDSGGDISLRREWPLAAFTFGAAMLVGVAAGAAAGTLRVAWWAFALAAAAVMGVAGAHLGRPSRGWRAMLNVRRSWLSREIVAMTLFAGSSTLWLLGGHPGDRAGWFVVGLGLVALYAADRVYAVLPSGPGYRHSASVLLTGVLFAALFAQRFNVVLAVLAVKLALYSWPVVVPGLPRWLPLLRIALGILVPLVAWSAAMLGHPAVLACMVAGEALDRCEYYIRIERLTPRRAFDGALLQAAGTRQAAGRRLSAFGHQLSASNTGPTADS